VEETGVPGENHWPVASHCINQFTDNLFTMLGKQPGKYWVICWKYISPLVIIVSITICLMLFVGYGSHRMVVGFTTTYTISPYATPSSGDATPSSGTLHLHQVRYTFIRYARTWWRLLSVPDEGVAYLMKVILKKRRAH
jgi:hypothetical protein